MLLKLKNNFSKNETNLNNNHLITKWFNKCGCNFFNNNCIDTKKRILLVGPPNVGKSTIFNKITKATAFVSNIDRVTVDNNYGILKKNKDFLVVDLPGLYNISHPIDEELIVNNELCCGKKSDKIVNVIGAQSIKRDLKLVIQSLETGKLSSIIINMIDAVNINNIKIDKLSKLLNNVEILPSQSNKKINQHKIIERIIKCDTVNHKLINYGKEIEKIINDISKYIPNMTCSKRWYALMILEKNEFIIDVIKTKDKVCFQKIENILKNNAHQNFPMLIETKRAEFIEKIIKNCIVDLPNNGYIKISRRNNHKIDKYVYKKFIGVPLLILLMCMIYYASFGPYMGGGLQKLLNENLFQELIRKNLNSLFNSLNWNEWWQQFITDGVLGGVFTLLSFIPPIFILFLMINIVQQIGIMSRISILLDSALEKFGLCGRDVINLITGFGCNVPSILATRSLNTKKEKIISIIVLPFICCSARTIFFAYISNKIFGENWGWLCIIIMLLASSIVTLLISQFFSNTLFKKTNPFFIVEVPNWTFPDILVAFKNVYFQIKNFIIEVASLILISNFLIWLFLHLGPNGPILNNKNLSLSFIGHFSKFINLIMFPLGGNSNYGWVKHDDGWKLTFTLISALPAKEIALTNMQLFFGDKLDGFFICYKNLPLIFSFLLIFMFYSPCISTMAVIIKEGGWKILGIHLLTSFFISYIIGLFAYWITFAFVH